MGAQKKTYQKIPCDYCSREIATNNMSVHHRSCEPREQYYALLHADKLINAPIETLTLGEATEAGRLGELAEALKRVREVPHVQ